MSKSIQDRYTDQFAHCFGCGRLNDEGYHVRSIPSEDDPGVLVAHHQPGAEYTAGSVTAIYGGLLAALVDCHSAGTASYAKACELGLPEDSAVPRFVTASLTVNFKAPTPAGVPLELRAWAESINGRKVWVDCEVLADGKVTVTGHTLMIMVNDG